MNKKWIASGLACIVSIGSVAHGAESGAYVGAFFGHAVVHFEKRDLDAASVGALSVSSFESTLDDSGEAIGLVVGYRFTRYLAAEVGRINFPDVEYRNSYLLNTPSQQLQQRGGITWKSKAYPILAVGILPLSSRFDVRARTGLVISETRRYYGSDTSAQDFAFGAGVGIKITEMFRASIDATRYFHVGNAETLKADIDAFTASLQVQF